MAAAHAGMSHELRERGAAMVERVFIEARAVLDETDARLVRDAVAAAVALRDAVIEDDHDPRYLHPARTVRILLSDVAIRDAHALAASALIDSLDAALMPAADVVGRDVERVVHAIPSPAVDADDALEAFVTAQPLVASVALAERLDQARHLHMRAELDWVRFHQTTRSVYVPAARRIAPSLARRFEHWADAFERRLLLRG